MKLGCSTILYGGHPLTTALEGIARAGYAAIELCAIPGMAPHVAPDHDLKTIKQRVADAGLAIESVGASGNLSRATIEMAGRLGAPAITSGSGGTEETFAETVAKLRELSHVAKDHGVLISIKPHVRQAVYDTTSALRLVNELDVGLNVDASHLVRAGEDPAAAIERLGSHVATARVRDAKKNIDGPGTVEQQIPGNGDLDVPALAQAIATLERPRYAVLEIVGTKDFPLAEVERVVRTSYERLQELF